jgi:hypothetical protein
MKTKLLTFIAVASFAGVTALQANTSSLPMANPASQANQLETVQFSNTAEAAKLHRAYRILAYGDHDYKGHRAAAMNQVKKAAQLLGLDLSGDDKNRQVQVLSDDELRDARGLLLEVRNSAEIKDQQRITGHLDGAIKQIDIALAIR